MELSKGEKLILLMLCDLQKKLGVRGDFDPDVLSHAIWYGHTWAIDRMMQNVGDETPPEVARTVVDVLDMWRFIEEAVNDFSQAERNHLRTAVQPFGEKPAFPGYDANNEIHYYSAAHMLVTKLGVFTYLNGRELNSHVPMVNNYARMLEAFDPMRATLIGKKLSVDQVIELVRARMLG